MANSIKNSSMIVGLDIGTSKVVCIVGKYNDEKKLEIIALGSYPSSGLKKGVVVNIDATTDAIDKAVEQAQSMIEEKIKSVYVGILKVFPKFPYNLIFSETLYPKSIPGNELDDKSEK